MLTPTLLAADSLRAELAAFKELGVSVIPVHSGDQFPRDSLTPMISCSASGLAGCDIPEGGEEAQAITAVRKYLFRENIRDVRNESHPEACGATLELLAARAAEVHLNRASKIAVPAGHYDHDVFISYHARDAWEVYESIAAVFEGLELNVFNASKDLQVTEVSSAEMIKHVKGSSCMVQVLTPNYLLSKWCRAELLAAQEAGIGIYVVYPSKKHTRTELLKLVEVPADFGSQNMEEVNMAKAAIRRAIEARGVTDVYNPDFAQAAAESLQAIALAALPKVSRRKWLVAMKRMLLCLLALVVVFLPLAYSVSMDILIEQACFRRDRVRLASALAVAVPVMSRSRVPGMRCLTKLGLLDDLRKIQNSTNVTTAAKGLLLLVGKYPKDWRMLHLILTRAKDMVGNEPELAAANVELVRAVVRAMSDVLLADQGKSYTEEVLRDALETLAVLASADSQEQVMKLAPPVMEGVLSTYWNKFAVASRAVEVLYRMARNIKRYSNIDLDPWLSKSWYRALLKVMRRFRMNGAMQRQGAVVLRAAAATTSQDVNVSEIAQTLVQALVKQAHRSNVCEKVVLALVAFTRTGLEATDVCEQLAIERSLDALAAAQAFDQELLTAVMQLVGFTATVPSCRQHALQAHAVDALGQGLAQNYIAKRPSIAIALEGFAALRQLAVDRASQQEVKVKALSVVLRMARKFVQDRDVAEEAAQLLAQLAVALRDSGNQKEQAGVLDLLLRLLQVHTDQSGVKMSSSLLNSTLQVVEKMAAGDPRHATSVSRELVRGLWQESKISATEMVVSSLAESSMGEPLCLELASLVKRISPKSELRPKAKRMATAIRLIGVVAKNFAVWSPEALGAVLAFIEVRNSMIREAAEEAMVAINRDTAAFNRTVGFLTDFMQGGTVINRSEVVRALVVVEERSLFRKRGGGLLWEQVDSVLQNASRGAWPAIWQSIQDVGPKMRQGEALSWLERALLEGPAAANAVPRLILGVQRSTQEYRQKAAEDLYKSAYAWGSVESRTAALISWALVATVDQVDAHLGEVSRTTLADPDADMRVAGGIALVRASAKASDKQCVEALEVVSQVLRKITDRSDRRAVIEAFAKRAKFVEGVCVKAARRVLRQCVAEDPSDALRAFANRTLLERYCPKQGCKPDG